MALYSRAVIIITVCLFLVQNSIARNSRHIIDSLTTTLQTAADTDKAGIYISIADEYRTLSGDSCYYYAHKAKDFAVKHNDRTNEAKAYLLIGVIERVRGDYELALKYCLRALRINMSVNEEDESFVSIYNSIGIIYKKMRRFEDALPYYIKANQLARKHNLNKEAAFTYNNIGTIHLEFKDWDKVVAYYDSALFFAEKSKNTRALATVLSNICDIHIEHKRYDSALIFIFRCLEYDKKNNDQYGLFMSYFDIAQIYAGIEKYDLSYAYMDSADDIAIKEHMARERVDILAWRSNVEEARGNFTEALAYYRKSRNVADTLFNEITSKQVSELQTKYETEKKEQQITLQKADINRRNYIIAGISGLFIVAILLGLTLYNKYKFKQKDRLQQEIIKQQELATQAVIMAEERERKRIAGDLHDGVGQTMSAAKMNLSSISNEIPFANEQQKNAFEKAIMLVDEGCKEVRTVSHNIMPNAILKSGFATAVRDFINKIDSKVMQVNLYIEGLDERLAGDTETVLYRVVQECVNNVIKHSKANTLDMSLIKDEDGVSITIEDNGSGFDMNQAKKKDGIGLQNLTTRINYLKGTIEWDTAIGKGTVVMIHVPVAHNS